MNSLEKSKSISEHQHIPHPRAPQDKPPVAQLAQLVGGGCSKVMHVKAIRGNYTEQDSCQAPVFAPCQ